MKYPYEQVRHLLKRARDILIEQRDTNWIPGLSNAITHLDSEDFEGARSIYCAMVAGGRGFSEYNIWNDDYQIRIEANAEIDTIRQQLWDVFSNHHS